MIKAINRYHIEQLYFPVDGYSFIVSRSTSVDGGNTFYYCGNSRYFRSDCSQRGGLGIHGQGDNLLMKQNYTVRIILRDWTKTNKANSPVIAERKETYHDHRRKNHSGKP